MRISRLILPGAATLAVVGGVAGASTLTSLTANADTSTTGDTSTSTTAATDTSSADTATTAASTTSGSSTTESTSGTSTSAQPDTSKVGHSANGITETVLTGDTYTKAVAAAQAAESGATVVRAETDAEGATYEVHMKKSDGSQVTVKLNANFNVTSTESGM